MALTPSCTYGPEEQAAKVAQIVRLGDSFRAIVVIRHDTYRQPTGLSAFPDGGKWRYLRRGSTQYLIDASRRTATLLAAEAAPDSVWESFEARIVGVEGDTAVYLRLAGCPRNGECFPDLRRSAYYRVSTTGSVATPPRIPTGVALPGVTVARRPGERNYVRFGWEGDTVTVKLDEAGAAVGMYRVRPDGSLSAIASSR